VTIRLFSGGQKTGSNPSVWSGPNLHGSKLPTVQLWDPTHPTAARLDIAR
jgi:hypothetical protein